MRSLPFKVGGAVVGFAIVLGLWAFFAPMELGGSTTYSVTAGISMEPLLHQGDLALVRHQSAYEVGDAVLYQSSVVNRPVLHRIILIQDGHYFFRGDNNDFVDPGYATRDELVGTMWFRVPKAGALIGWFGEPAHAALLAGLTAMAIIRAGNNNSTKRRRRRHRGANTMIPTPEPIHRGAVPQSAIPHAAPERLREPGSRRPRPYFDGPASTLVALGVVMALAVVFLATGFSQPLRRTGTLTDAYSQAGTFTYSANTNAPNAVYPTGVVVSGDPIYPSLVDVVTLRFEYQFSSELPHDIRGTIELHALVLSQVDTWQEVSTVIPATEFTGDATAISTDLPLASLFTLISSVSSQSGIAGTNYSVDIQPLVHITGTVDGESVDQRYSPVLPFAVTTSAIRLDVAAAPLPPGATYEPASAGSSLVAALHPVESGSIPHPVANELSIAKYHFSISLLRSLGIAFALASLVVAFVHDRRRRRGPRPSAEELVAKRANALIVPVAELGPGDGHTLIEVPDFAHLAGLAQFLERPILYELRNGVRTYAVDDETRRYLTTAAERRQGRTPSSEVPSAGTPPQSSTQSPPQSSPRSSTPVPQETGIRRRSPGRRPARKTVTRVGALLMLMAVSASLTLGLTASNTVPASRIGRSVQPGAVDQARPTGCASISLTNLVTGSGTFSSNASNALILGSAGVDTINATGQYNCIIGGGGRDRVTSTTTSFCIIGPTSGTTYSKCVTKPR